MASIDRKPHALRAEKTLAIPRHVIFFDTETDQKVLPSGDTIHTLKLGWACYLRKQDNDRLEKLDWLFFTTTAEFWAFVEDKCIRKNRLWVIAHNLNFDFTVAKGLYHLRLIGFKVKFFYCSNVTTLIKVTGPKKSIIFVDTLNWFRESLEQLGKRLGLEKLKIDFDNCTWTELKRYCKRDVEILIAAFRSLTTYLFDQRISRLCYTIGSTAMAAYLLSHYHTKILIHNNREAVNLERASYKGGRTECFYLGELNNGPYYIVDVNSLYPFVMRANLYPISYRKILNSPTCRSLRRYLKSKAVIAKVLISTDRPVYAVRRERTLFPVGIFWETLTTPELLYGFKHGHIKEIATAVVYEQAEIFTGFVDRFYKLRQGFKAQKDDLYDYFTKKLMNSLYGKFGQKGEIWNLIGDAPNEPDRTEDLIDVVTHRRRRLRYLLGQVFELIGHEETRHSFPAISSHVTAYARLYLYKLMQVVGPGNFYYCDTDSLFVNLPGKTRLSKYLSNSELGGLKLDQTTDKITIYGLKDYITDDKTAIKGISKKAKRISNVIFEQEKWPTLKGMLATGNVDDYVVHKQVKHLQREYTKGTVEPNGWIRPFELDEIQLPF